MNDNINPTYYRDGPVHGECGQPIECNEVREGFPTNLADAIKYIWRTGRKDDAGQDLDKAIWYLEAEKSRLSAPHPDQDALFDAIKRASDKVMADWERMNPSQFKDGGYVGFPTTSEAYVDTRPESDTEPDVKDEPRAFEPHTMRRSHEKHTYMAYMCSCGGVLAPRFTQREVVWDAYRDHLRREWGC